MSSFTELHTELFHCTGSTMMLSFFSWSCTNTHVLQQSSTSAHESCETHTCAHNSTQAWFPTCVWARHQSEQGDDWQPRQSADGKQHLPGMLESWDSRLCVCTGDTHFRTALQVWCVIVLFEKIFFYIWNLSESLDLKQSKGNYLKIWLFEKDRWIKRAEERTEELRLYCNFPVNVM